MKSGLLILLVLVLVIALPSGVYAEEKVPGFWKSRVSDVNDVMESVRKGQVKVETVSPGGRAVYSVIYGDFDPYERTANFGSAALSYSPEAFARRGSDAKPVLMVLTGVHGQEMETIVGALNLIRIMETGSDFRGRAWPEIAEKGSKYRLVIMPCCNPDGRARVPKDSFVGVPADTMTWYAAVGHCYTLANGSRRGWRLPGQAELSSLVDYEQSDPSLPPGHPFQDIQAGQYWSANTFPGHNSSLDHAWLVDMNAGGSGWYFSKTTSAYTWCVRGGHGIDVQSSR